MVVPKSRNTIVNETEDDCTSTSNEMEVTTVNSRIHPNIGQCFKSKDNKFGGTEDKNMVEFLITCESATDE